jgi:hypothetical protein
MSCVATSVAVACSVDWSTLVWVGLGAFSLLASAVLIIVGRRRA